MPLVTRAARPASPVSAKRNDVSPRARVAIFTHDTFGLGHVRRSLHIMNGIAERDPGIPLLLVTGSPAFPMMRHLPANADVVKIPTVVKSGNKKSAPPHLPISMHETLHLRERVLREVILGYQPDIFLVDNFPLGSRSELLPLLQDLRRRSVHTVLGLRDILDAPEVVRTDWERQGIYDVLERYYDEILVYGDQSVFDLGQQYALPPTLRAKLRYCGYLTSDAPLDREPGEIRAEFGGARPFLLATGGGGGDAYPLLRTFLEAVQGATATGLIITGPLMSTGHIEKIRALATKNPNMHVREFVPDLRPYLAAADVAVTMCGYNVAAELVMHRPPCIAVPRTWRYGDHEVRKKTGVEREQAFRAEALERRGIVNRLDPADLDAATLAEKIGDVLARPRPADAFPAARAVSCGGLRNAVDRLLQPILTRRQHDD